MSDVTQNIVLEHLKRIQAEQSASRDRDKDILTRLSGIESALARIGRDQAAAYEEMISDRHAVDRLGERLERIERRLDLRDA